MKLINLIVILICSFILAACGKESTPSAPRETPAQAQAREEAEANRLRDELEEARELSRSNAAKAAGVYQLKSPRLTGASIIPRADVAISLSCLHGSGWAYVNFVRPKTSDEIAEEKAIKPNKAIDSTWKTETICPTYTTSLDCMRLEDIGKLTNGVNPKVCGNVAEIGRRLKGL